MFSQFLRGYDSLMEQIAQLVESDTIDFDPNVGRQYIGTGVNRNTATPGRPQAAQPQQQAPAQVQAQSSQQRAKQGDIVFMPGPGNQMIPTLVSMTDQNRVMMINQKKGLKAIRNFGDLRPAPAAMMSKFPGRTGWMIAGDQAAL